MHPPFANSLPDALPVIDMGGLGDPAAEAAIARALDAAFSRIGFCYFTNLGIDPGLVDALLAQSRRFHALPASAKQAIAMNDYHRGYMAPNTSLIATSSVARVSQPNFSESLMVMHEISPDSPRYGQPLQGPNQWPAELPGFRDAIMAYFAAMARACRRVLRPLGLALGLPPGWEAPYFDAPTAFLRLLHYPPQPPEAPDDAFGSAPHTDYGVITVLVQDSSGGLEVRRRDGTWLPAPPIPGSWVVNVGDMLARWTNGHWQSTPHRVKNLSGTDRYSCPFFYDMDMDSEVACLPTCCDADNPARYPPVRYGDYLLERLNKNYAYRHAPAVTPDTK
jgi:isopenicillin N synthase-like dioxygenase